MVRVGNEFTVVPACPWGCVKGHWRRCPVCLCCITPKMRDTLPGPGLPGSGVSRIFVEKWRILTTRTGHAMRDLNDAGTLDLISGRLLLGYARVSTGDQDRTNQRAELHAAGWTQIFREDYRDAARPAGAGQDARSPAGRGCHEGDPAGPAGAQHAGSARYCGQHAGGWRRPTQPGRVLGRHDDAGRAHGADGVRRHCGVRTVADHRPHQKRAQGGQGPRGEVRAAPTPPAFMLRIKPCWGEEGKRKKLGRAAFKSHSRGWTSHHRGASRRPTTRQIRLPAPVC